MNTSRLSLFCDKALEAGWLLAVTITPVFFNVYSSRVFEPDKLTTMRALAVVMAVLWLTRVIDEASRGGRPLRFSLKTPLVLPALATMAIYLISTATSLVPFTSMLGSYQRLQGTFTLFSYLVIFFAILTGLRTRVQLSRLVTVLILNSLPVSLYGIIQHNGLDPLPWAGDVTTRVAANMGNSIFVAAYLIMIVPLTGARIVQSFGDILGREESRTTDVLKASGYIFVLAVQLLTLWYSQSRGPWLGIVASAFRVPSLALIVLQRQSPRDGNGKQGDWGWSSAASDLAGARWRWLAPSPGLPISFSRARSRSTLRWGWPCWSLADSGSISSLNAKAGSGCGLAGERGIGDCPRPDPDQRSGTPSGSGPAGVGAAEVDDDHRTAVRHGQSPRAHLAGDGGPDLHPRTHRVPGREQGPSELPSSSGGVWAGVHVRRLQLLLPPELGHYESRTASPDRSHNEVLDSLVITGVLGLAIYLFTFVSFFAWGFHWLGLLSSRRDLLIYIGMDVFFATVFFIVAWRPGGCLSVCCGHSAGHPGRNDGVSDARGAFGDCPSRDLRKASR